jgi:arylsulfatase A
VAASSLGRRRQPEPSNRKGFDQLLGQLAHSHANQKYSDYLWENFDRWEIPENRNNGGAVFVPDLINARALEFIERNQDQLFLLYLGHNLCCGPSGTGPG